MIRFVCNAIDRLATIVVVSISFICIQIFELFYRSVVVIALAVVTNLNSMDFFLFQ